MTLALRHRRLWQYGTLPRAAAMLASAAAWLGPVVRDIPAVRDQLERTPRGQASNRRAAAVALGLLGDLEVTQHPAIALDDPMDVVAIALAVVGATLMPPMGLDARVFDHGGRLAIRHGEMLDTIRSLETRIRESSTGERAAALHVAAAVQRIWAERWFEESDHAGPGRQGGRGCKRSVEFLSCRAVLPVRRCRRWVALRVAFAPFLGSTLRGTSNRVMKKWRMDVIFASR
jgi:hypothetical protein